MSRPGYAKVSHQLHTGRVGRAIRGETPENLRAQSLAAYLISCPHGNALGLFHLPVGYVMADRGWKEETTLQTMDTLQELGFCRYDKGTEWCWVVDTFRHEQGPCPSSRGRSHDDGSKEDSRIPMIRRLLTEARSSPFLGEFKGKYLDAYPYLLGGWGWPEDAPSDGAFDAPSTVVSRATGARAPAPSPSPSPYPYPSPPPLPSHARASETPGRRGAVGAPAGNAGEDQEAAIAEEEEKEMSDFDLWEVSYPEARRKHRGRRDGRRAWGNIPPEERPTAEAVKAFLVTAKAHEHWKEDGGRWVPGLESFVKNRVWEEDPETWATRNKPPGKKSSAVKGRESSDETRERRKAIMRGGRS